MKRSSTMINEIFAPLTELLNDFARTFDEEYSVKFNSDFQANVSEMRIYYTIVMSDPDSKAFRENFVHRFPSCADFDIFILSFMHELGHLETEWDMEDDVNLRNEIQDHEKYFNLHNEWIATEWAGNYLTKNHDQMKQFEKIILATGKNLIEKYYSDC